MIDQTNDAYDELVAVVVEHVDAALVDAAKQLATHPDCVPLDVMYLETNAIAELVIRTVNRWVAGHKPGDDPEDLRLAGRNMRNMLNHISGRISRGLDQAPEPANRLH